MIRNFGKRVPGDGNTAASSIAYALSETSFIYPISPATPMGEKIDTWITQGKKNIWGNPVHLRMMQAESGAAAAVHGATSVGTLASSFTASQGLLLMIPDLYRLAAEYCPAVIHVAARSLAQSGLSIYNDHGDVYCTRSTGVPMLCSNNAQEVLDLASVAHLTTIKTSLPFLHFFDAYRTSDEINTYEEIDYDIFRKLVDPRDIAKIRARSLNPEHPTVRGPILGPEFVWQAVEAPAQAFKNLVGETENMMKRFGDLTGRYYKPMEYVGTPHDEKVIIMMGSGCDTVEEFIRTHPESKIGLVKIRLYRPFSAEYLLNLLPSTINTICVLDKLRDNTGVREPLFLDVCTAVLPQRTHVKFIGGRYGISSKDFAPQHVESIANNLLSAHPKDNFTVGVRNPATEIPVGNPKDYLPISTKQCLFYGIGADGTVGANKEAIKLIVDNTPLYGQAYFAYDAHKSGGLTVSHVRFGEKPITAPYYVQQADYIACNNPAYLQKFDMISNLKQNGTFVVNIAEGTDFNKAFPADMRKKLAELNVKVYFLDAIKISTALGIPGRINMIMQTAFFVLSQVMEKEKAIELLKKAISKQYAKKGKDVIEKNQLAVDKAVEGIVEVKYDRDAWLNVSPDPPKPEKTGFLKIVQASIENRGNDISAEEWPFISAMPPGTSKLEKRGIAITVPVWREKKCIQCNLCSVSCPHSVIRPFVLSNEEKKGLVTIAAKGKEFKGFGFRIQISPYDCTGCGVCVNACPADALSMTPIGPFIDKEQKNFDQCISAKNKGHLIKKTTVRGSQFQQPLIEFNGACQGCGEPAIIKLITQLYGDQLLLACATGCSLIWGGTFPFNPYTTNEKGHGPGWANSLFEENAEFGYGIVHSIEARRNNTYKLIKDVLAGNEVSGQLKKLLEEIVQHWTEEEKTIQLSEKIQPLLKALPPSSDNIINLQSQADVLAKKVVFIMGGDGWAYDIGYGGLDHVLASGEDVNIIVLDTEVYSNTGGQCSKATSRGAIANFSSAGYEKAKKDMGAIAITYGNIYVANTCLLADPAQALKAIIEAKEYKGPSLIINYSPCIAHGVRKGLGTTPDHCKELVKSGYLILYRYDPRRKAQGKNPLQLDSKKPSFDLSYITRPENRYSALVDLFPKQADIKLPQLSDDLKSRYEYYLRMSQEK